MATGSSVASDATLYPREDNSNYRRLACLMGKHPSMAMFRTFSALQAQVVLFKQAELVHLERKIQGLIIPLGADADGNPNWAQSWTSFEDSDERHLYFDKLTGKLKDYYEALSSLRNIDSMAKPTEADLSSLRTWLVNDKGGHRFLDGIEGLTYSHPDMESDLVAISDRQRDRDLFSVWLSDSFVRLLYRHLPAMFKNADDPSAAGVDEPAIEANLKHFDDRQLKRCSILVIIGVALVVPIASLYVLYCIPAADVLARLSAVVGFSAVFAACLAVFTRARSVEVFAATAAFAAVEIVFVSNAGSGSGSPPGLS